MVGRTNIAVVLQTIVLTVVKQQRGRIFSDQGEFLLGGGDPFNDQAVLPVGQRAMELHPGDTIVANYIPGKQFNTIIDFIKI